LRNAVKGQWQTKAASALRRNGSPSPHPISPLAASTQRRRYAKPSNAAAARASVVGLEASLRMNRDDFVSVEELPGFRFLHKADVSGDDETLNGAT